MSYWEDVLSSVQFSRCSYCRTVDGKDPAERDELMMPLSVGVNEVPPWLPAQGDLEHGETCYHYT